LVTGVMLAAGHGWMFYENTRLWGEPVYTNRGDALLWGHNPLARGSWEGTFDVKGSPGYQYQVQHIADFETIDELHRSRAQQALAIAWIENHPWEELALDLRKVAIVFLPYNLESTRINFGTLALDLGFVTYLFFFVFHWRTEVRNEGMMLALA